MYKNYFSYFVFYITLFYHNVNKIVLVPSCVKFLVT